VWALVVVNGEPISGKQLHLLDRFEQVRIEDLAATRSVEPFNERVLVGLARRDVHSRNSALLAPFLERRRRELRTIAQSLRLAVLVDQAIENTDHPGARHARADLDRQSFPIALIEIVERAESAPLYNASCMKSIAQTRL
jgi:hypothetical protein